MANIGALSICGLLLSALALPNALAAEYTLMPNPQTVHVGHFSAALKPVLTINSGDIVIIETVSGPDPEEVDASGVVPPSAVPEYVRTIRREVTDPDVAPRSPMRQPGTPATPHRGAGTDDQRAPSPHRLLSSS